ncbi:hypothetical protein NQ318_009475 [Aromia moschata]|uniref:Uncharacterized protein n=1 Tax=Aromia moschata TaxID=1265417 RepID=A0AAV8Z766_9CUCU|nr:hypothetical protein NQ318_009475 [Aromia moschata]
MIYEVYKLSNETGNVAPDLATLRRRDLKGRKCVLKMSDINFEQRCAIRFRPGHSATDTFAKLQHAYGDSVFQEPKFSGGLRHSQKEDEEQNSRIPTVFQAAAIGIPYSRWPRPGQRGGGRGDCDAKQVPYLFSPLKVARL